MTDSVKNMDWRNARGHLCEVICAETLIRQGYWVYSTTMLGPVDLVAIRSDPMEVRLLDVKSERTRLLAGYQRRITRLRTPTQKKLGVQLVYVDADAGTVHFSEHRDGKSDKG